MTKEEIAETSKLDWQTVMPEFPIKETVFYCGLKAMKLYERAIEELPYDKKMAPKIKK